MTPPTAQAPYQVAQIIRSGGGGSAPGTAGSQPGRSAGTLIAQPALEGGPLARAQNLGFQYSNIAGSGLTYRNWSNPSLGFSISAFPQQETVNGVTSGVLNYGGQLMLPFYNSGTTRLYGLLAGGVGDFAETRDTNIAPGVGADYAISSQFLINVGLGLSVFNSVPKVGGTLPPRFGQTFGYTLGGQFCF
ncbi:MAG: hypothetical protein VKO21_03425 [Candidatus Sericytochromatia bacterium]|nr:hypothetical protein [Candidatus Sericytochromatia bacterium]